MRCIASLMFVVVTIFSACNAQSYNGMQTVWDVISKAPELQRFRAQVQATLGLKERLSNTAHKYTVFAYTDDAYEISRKEGHSDLTLPDTIKYHIYDATGSAVIRLSDFGGRESIKTMIDTPVYTAKAEVLDAWGVRVMKYFVNHAAVLDRDYINEYQVQQGIVYMIDRVLVPVGQPSSIYGFIQKSENKVLKFDELISTVVQVDPKFQTTLQNFVLGTAFIPQDQAFAKVPPQYFEKLKTDANRLKDIVRAHFNFNSAYFTGLLQPGELYPMEFSQLEIIKDEFNNGYYITCNSVRSKLLIANMPMSNGVIHIIEDVLFPYEDLMKKLRSQPDLQQFVGMISENPELSQMLSYDGTDVPHTKFTIMGATDKAIADGTRLQGPNKLDLNDRQALDLLLKSHILRDEIRMGDIKRELTQAPMRPGELPRFVRRSSIVGTDLKFYRIGNGNFIFFS